jgi:hypothetical protein
MNLLKNSKRKFFVIQYIQQNYKSYDITVSIMFDDVCHDVSTLYLMKDLNWINN